MPGALNTMKLSVIIKCLNEENNIARCIESVLAATVGINTEIILVDSISTDRTIDIAKTYPIQIIQFRNKEDSSCGSAPQLGYQESTGDLIYLIDGDMEMAPGFLKSAIEHLLKNDAIAGVGGILNDTSVNTSESIRRHHYYSKIQAIAEVSSLGGGGLYRRTAIKDVGYFSHQSLKSCEEAELGVRLKHHGWKLIRLPIVSVYHTGHQETVVQSLIRLWKNGRLESHGLFIKSALHKKWLRSVILLEWFVIAPLLINTTLIFVCLATYTKSPILALFTLPLGWIAIVIAMCLKKKSLKPPIVSILSWHILLLASIKGFLGKLKNPHTPIPFTTILNGPEPGRLDNKASLPAGSV